MTMLAVESIFLEAKTRNEVMPRAISKDKGGRNITKSLRRCCG